MTSSHGSRTPGSIPVTTTSSHDRRRAGTRSRSTPRAPRVPTGGSKAISSSTNSSTGAGRTSEFFDLGSKDRTSPPRGVNTRRWEYWPTISGQWLLFGRRAGDESREIILYDLSTRDATKLDEVGGRDTFLAPGQVNGDYAVWYRCTRGTKCNVILYNISDGVETKIPNPGAFQYAPSVSSDGTVTFARSAQRMRQAGTADPRPPQRPETVFCGRLPSGGDVATTRVHRGHAGETRRSTSTTSPVGNPPPPTCGRSSSGERPSCPSRWRDSGSVTSSPAGINCGSDCTETYDPGTGVTLTADAAGRIDLRGVGRSVHRQQHDLHAHDERREIGNGDLHDETRADRDKAGNRWTAR